MDKLKRVVIFLAAFVLSKGVTFLTPIIVSNIASVEEYGLVEYALSLGFMLSAPISLGFHGAYPYFNLKLQKEGYRSLYEAHCLFIFAIAVFFIFAYLGNGRPVFLGISIGVIVAIQMIKSSIQKTHERIQIASVLDSGIYYAVSFFVLGLYLFNKSFRTSDLVIPLGLYLLLLFFWSLKDFLKTKKDWGFARFE